MAATNEIQSFFRSLNANASTTPAGSTVRSAVHCSINGLTRRARWPRRIRVKSVRFVQMPFVWGRICQINCYLRQCYGHATECYYNPEVDEKGLSINAEGNYSGGGVCVNCSVRVWQDVCVGRGFNSTVISRRI